MKIPWVGSRERPTTAQIAAEVLGPATALVVDVGARWGAADSWYRLRPLARLIGFEPDAAECAPTTAKPSTSERFVPVALGAEKGRRTLYVTREPGCSSLYEPDPGFARRYPLLDVVTVERTIEIDVGRLDEWSQQEGIQAIDFMKLDVQGAELDVLRGAGALLDGVLGFEAEVEFFPIYRGQCLFGDIDVFARAHGFSLWRLGNLVHYAERHRDQLHRAETAVYDGVSSRSAAGAGRLAWGHALYLRDYRDLDASDRRGLLVLAAILDAAGDIDGVAACLRRILAAHEDMEPTARSKIAGHLESVEGRRGR